MKHSIRIALFLVVVTALSVTIGCARSSSGDAPAQANILPTPPPLPPTERPPVQVPPEGRFNWTTGATTDLFVDSIDVMSDFAKRPVNYPNADEGIILKMNVLFKRDSETGGFYGTIKLGYEELNAQNDLDYHEPKFETGRRPEDMGYLDNNDNPVPYHGVVTVAGNEHFKAFTQDQIGALIIVIDEVATGSGAIYFRNFADATIQQGPAKKCWAITIGPYDCRDFLVGSGSDQDKKVQIDSSLLPNRVKNSQYFYKKLGEFSGLDLTKAIEGLDD